MRSFIIENSNQKYKAETPREAAKKAAKHILETKQKAMIKLRETTKSSNKKLYKFEATKTNDNIVIKSKKIFQNAGLYSHLGIFNEIYNSMLRIIPFFKGY